MKKKLLLFWMFMFTVIFGLKAQVNSSRADMATYRMPAEDYGIVLSPSKEGEKYFEWDGNGIREGIVNKVGNTYYLFYDGAAHHTGVCNLNDPERHLWRAMLAKSTDLITWEKLGVKLWCGYDTDPASNGDVYKDFGSASSPWAYFSIDEDYWYLFYLGAEGSSPSGTDVGTPGYYYSTLVAKALTKGITGIEGEWQQLNRLTGNAKAVALWQKPATCSPGSVIENPLWKVDPVNNKRYMMFVTRGGQTHIARSNKLDGIHKWDETPDINGWDFDYLILDKTGNTSPENATIYYDEKTKWYFLFTNQFSMNYTYTECNIVYWSKDPNSWNPKNSALITDPSTTKNGWAIGAIGMPSVAKIDDNTLGIIYDAQEGSLKNNIGRKIALAYWKIPSLDDNGIPGVCNGSFETPDATEGNVGLPGVLKTPVTSGWVFDNNSFIMKNGCAYGQPDATDRVQCGAFQNGGAIYQNINLDAGNYVLILSAAQRAGNAINIPITVTCDGTVVGTLTANSQTGYSILATPSFVITAGIHKIQLSAQGSDFTVFFDNVQLVLESALPTTLLNSSFETPDVAGGSNFVLRPTGGTWLFEGGAAISNNSSSYGPPAAIYGSQCVHFQGAGSAISQVVYLTAGNYKLYFQGAQRSGNASPLPVQVTIDGNLVETLTPSTTGSYSSLSTSSFAITAGYHTIRLEAVTTPGDVTVFIDNVCLVPATTNPTWDSRPAATFTPIYSQVFNTSWDNAKFYGQWETIDANAFTAADIAAGYLQFEWTAKRVMCSKNVYASPYTLETEIEYPAEVSSRAGVVIRVAPASNNEIIQEPALGDPGFNSEGIAFYPTDDGSKMIVQFTGIYVANATPVTRISVPKPVDIASFRDRALLRIEDFGTSIYVFYNNAPLCRIDLTNLIDGIYTSGTVYDSDMQVAGTFSGMEVAVSGRVAIAQRNSAFRLYSALIKTAVPWDNRPATNFVTKYSQAFNTVWDNTKFYDQWETLLANAFTAADIAAGYLQFEWSAKRVMCSKSSYASPYVMESDIDYSTGGSQGGVVIRVAATNMEDIQEPASGDPGFNREGIAFYPNVDGSSMTVQFTGAINGSSTPVTRISVSKPYGVASLRNRGTLRVEDYGSSVYVFYNDAPYIRINLGGLTGANYTSGTVYNAAMQVEGTFTAMEVAVLGKVAVAQRTADFRLYSVNIKVQSNVPDAPTTVSAVAGNKQASVSFSAPLYDGGIAITGYTVTSSPGNFKQTGTTSPLVVIRLANGTAYTFTVVATNELGNSLPSEVSNSVTPATVPDAPTDVIAAARNMEALVAFTAPVVNGGSEVLSYTVNSTPGNFSQTGTASPLVLTGLDNGTAYTFTVVATNLVGNSIESAISNEVTPVDNTALKENQHSAIRVYQSGSALVVDLNGLSGLQNVYLTDVLGKPVVSRKAYGGEKLEISNRLLSGVYFVRVQGTNKTQVTKVIVK